MKRSFLRMRVGMARCVALASAVCLIPGCVPPYPYELLFPQRPPGAETVSRAQRKSALPAEFTALNSTKNGVETEMNTPFAIRAMSKIADAGVFSEVRLPAALGTMALLQPQDSDQSGPHVSLKLTAVEYLNPHTGAHILTVLAYSISLFLLVPVLSLPEEEYEVRLTLEAVRPDGAARRYESFVSGRIHFIRWGAFPEAERELLGKASTWALNDIANQLTADASFYGAGS